MTISALILKNLKKCKKLFILFCMTFLFSNILLPLEPWLISRFIGYFEITNKTLALQHCIFVLQIMVIYYIIRALINGFYSTYIKEKASAVLNTNITIDLFTMAHAHSIRYFDEEMSGRVSAAINNFSSSLTNFFADILFFLIRPLCILAFSFFIIFTFSPLLSLCLFALNIPYFCAVYIVNRHFTNLCEKSTQSQNNATGILIDSIANANLVKYSGSFFSEQLYFYKSLKQSLYSHAKRERYHIFSRFAFHAVDTVFITICIILILAFTKYNNIALDNLFYAYTTIANMITSITMLNNFCQKAASSLGTLQGCFAVINKSSEIIDRPDAHKLRTNKASVSFNNVNFHYIPGHPVFEKLNLQIPAGQKVGIVGYSGSGKSTLINLLLRHYDIQSGAILINHTDIRNLALNSLHKHIAIVTQDTFLFNRSIKENIRFGRPHAADKEIIHAAKQACIHDTITALPNGYDSIVGERGVLLSGGERQRIAIARTILQNAPLLILDEATSALDSESEMLIEKALSNLIKDKTVIAIAHRLSTLKNMDRIIVLNKGKIVEDGLPEELLNNRRGIYRKFCQMQTNRNLKYGEKQ